MNRPKKKEPSAQFTRYLGPVIEALRELGGSGRPDEVRAVIARTLRISEAEQSEPLPSGVQTRFENQVHWARFYLAKAEYTRESNGFSASNGVTARAMGSGLAFCLPVGYVAPVARPLRIEFPGTVYHVTSRGDRREPIFDDEADRDELLAIVGRACECFDAVGLAYCLMPNHYHFVLETRRANLSRLMRHVNGVYTQRYNRRHGKVGHLFQGRFKAIVVDRDAYLLEVCRYVDLNAVRAKLARRPQDWQWSSYRAHVGLAARPAWLASAALLQQFSPSEARGQKRYAEFVAQGRGVRLWEELRGQIYLGDEQFVGRVLSQAKLGATSREVPRAQRYLKPRGLNAYLADAADRDAGIAQAYTEGGFSQTDIARALGLSVSRVSRIISGVRQPARRDSIAESQRRPV